jgi:dipeptidyl aminopeptidase/acylaminoacyl peptidase
VLLAARLLAFPAPGAAQSFSIDDILSPGYPMSLVSAKAADRIAWIEVERGMRNLYTASAPDFMPSRLTRFLDDDGQDMSNAQISDDGEVVAFIRGHTPNRDGRIANVTSDPRGTERAIWAVNTSGGEPWRVAEAWNLALSPNGKWVAHSKNGTIYGAALDPGPQSAEAVDAPPPLFDTYGDNSGPVWSPDSRYIAFESARDDHSYVGVYDTERPSVIYLSPGVDWDSSPTWSPDGRYVAFIRRPGEPFGSHADPGSANEDDLPDGLLSARFAGGYDWSIWVADAHTGEGRELWHNEPGDSLFSEIRTIQWAGESIVFQAEPDGWRHYYSVPVADPDEGPILLTPGDGIAEHIGLSGDGYRLYYASNAGDIDRRHLWRVNTSGGKAEQLTFGEGVETYPSVLASGTAVATLAGSHAHPLSVGLVPMPGGEVEYITDLPARYPLDQHVMPEAVTLTAEDGFEFYNQIFMPPDIQPGEKRPALLFIHGGPRRQMLLGYHYLHFYHMAYAMTQYFANQGYIVVSVNYRGGTGYGRAFRNAPGRVSAVYRDIIAVGRYLASRPDVDAERIGVWGLSYGGLLTAQALARNSDVFAAGVDMAGWHLAGDSLDPEALSYRSSAISAVEKWASPVLLIHGDDDRTYPFTQTVGLVQALRANQVPFELIVFPDADHDWLLYERWLIAFEAADEFFHRGMVRGEPVEVDGRRPPGR